MRFGEELRQERERRGISLDDVAGSTRVSLRHLHALESNQFGELPGGVFNRGIVRSYARCCGLDSEQILESFTAAMRASGMATETREDDWVEFAEAVKRNRKPSVPSTRWRWLGVMAMVAGVLLLAAGVMWMLARHGIVPAPHLFRKGTEGSRSVTGSPVKQVE